MYQYSWDVETGGLLLSSQQSKFSKEPRPVYYRELNLLGMNSRWSYPQNDDAPVMWAEANNYIYRGRTIAKTKGGSLYTCPEVIYTTGEDEEPEGAKLVPIDVAGMVESNREIMNGLVEETAQNIYKTYYDYIDKVDLFYVAFSGGKDSIVTLDLVQRTLPHDAFKVVFGDTQMEFPDTYDTVDCVELWCKDHCIDFLRARSKMKPSETWAIFGPPATTTRWCCSVHKTAPQILMLRKELEKYNFRGLAFLGIRGDESLSRSKYEYLSLGEKHRGQYSCNPILDWNSAEVFLYAYAEDLIINDSYKKGNRRAGCLICPRAAERNDYMSRYWYRKEADTLIESIRWAYRDAFPTYKRLDTFIENGGWKARKNGRDIAIPVNYEESKLPDSTLLIEVMNAKTEWKDWIKTIGILDNSESPYRILFRNEYYIFYMEEYDSKIIVKIEDKYIKKNPDFSKLIKNVFRKTACCVGCQECQADCPYGCLTIEDGKVYISTDCRHCALCHKTDKGCLVYKSLERPKGGITMQKSISLNTYSHHAPKMDWLEQYFTYKNDFKANHTLGNNMYDFFIPFLRNAKLLDANGFSYTAERVEKLGLHNETSWGIIFVNLCYSRQVGWYVTTVPFSEPYSKDTLAQLMIDDGAKETWTSDVFASLARMGDLPMGNIGFGHVYKQSRTLSYIERTPWLSPIPEVILYSLYKFAEACDGYCQFSLTVLMDNTIEREGISPSRIFGLDRDTMIRICNGLAINYPDFISASFTFDLDTITLHKDKTSQDVLELFV